ncbi:hypothetical protein CAEBREN_16935 [Caenorhabditis brenneri]|uniref:Uncharacterized protein n=1 Tax=Caenorhabditis brenneri TaxID=135651 RepID=G0P0R3_CAEBE|nr:hypothetical protein CAEBREN_16935 [Caenorhabditis brenneri]
MKYRSIVLFVFVVVASCQENHGCEVGCKCPDFPSLFKEGDENEYFYEKHDDCSFNLTCAERTAGALYCKFSESEIPTPPVSYNGYLLYRLQDLIGSPYNGPLIPPYDVYSFFGLICENGSWYATKYPIGIQYRINFTTSTVMGSAEEYEAGDNEI